MSYEYGMGAKWVELLKQIAPGVMRVAVIRDPAITAGTGQFGAIQSMVGVEVSPISARDAPEIERASPRSRRSSNGGLVVTQSALTAVHRDLIITLAARYKLPAVYFQRSFVAGGGLVSYGTDFVDQYRQAATYVDRIQTPARPRQERLVAAGVLCVAGRDRQHRPSTEPLGHTVRLMPPAYVKPYEIGVLLIGGPEPMGPFYEALRDRGYIEGRNVQFVVLARQREMQRGFPNWRRIWSTAKLISLSPR